VFVPPCPNDCGISLGAIKQVYPNIPLIKHPFSHNLPDDAHELKIARREFYTSNVTINEIAQVLANGKIIGTIVGPLEIGPRALGNRSYLASPLIPGMKNRINSQQIKDREVWRPVAPILTIESMAHYFDNVLPSPYMTFAPAVKSEFRKLLGEIMHIDCSARIQTVTSSDGWIYWLLKEFGKITSHEILMNTSFNTKGNPLINSYGDAFKLLKTSSLDAVLVGSSSDKFELFSKAERISYE
jgi:carbamoyltransferase